MVHMAPSSEKQAVYQSSIKAELHVHIEGCIEPAMALEMAQRNGVQLPFSTLEEAAHAFKEYEHLQQFLDLRDATLQVLVTEQDFFEVTELYLSRSAAQNIVHTEIFFDPQVHTMRGIGFDTFMPGMLRAIEEAKLRHGISAMLLMCFMTELGPEGAEQTLQQAMPYIKHVTGIGLARGIPNWTSGRAPHTAFAPIFKKCAALGLRLTAHAGEEGPADEIWEAITELGVERIDHGVSCLKDPKLMQHLVRTRLPLTVCPLSNLKLQIYKGVLFDKMRELLATDVCVTVNSDDPPFFGGYVNENFDLWAEKLDLSTEKLRELVCNSFEGSFLPAEEKASYLQQLLPAANSE